MSSIHRAHEARPHQSKKVRLLEERRTQFGTYTILRDGDAFLVEHLRGGPEPALLGYRHSQHLVHHLISSDLKARANRQQTTDGAATAA